MTVTKYAAIIDEFFTEDQEQARRALKDMAFVFNYMDEAVASPESVDPSHMSDAFLIALYGMSNNPLGAIVAPTFRPIILDVVRSGTHQLAKRFLSQAIPSLATLMNGKSPLDYDEIHDKVKKALQ